MARLFDDASSEYLQIETGIVTAPPLTMAAWANSDDTPASWQCILHITDHLVADQYHGLFFGQEPAGHGVVAASLDGTIASAQSTSDYSINTWHHACGVWASSTDRRAFIDGGNKGTESTSKTPEGIDRTRIGATGDSTPTAYFSGKIAEAAIWNVALTDAEVAVLAKGCSPLFVRPQNLVAYWPLVRGLNDRVGGNNLTVSGTAVSVQPRIIYPAPIQISYAPYAPPAGIPILRRRRECA